MKTINISVGNVDHGDRERIVKWLRSGESVGGDDMVARTIADALERGEDIEHERRCQLDKMVKSVAWLARKDEDYLSPTFPKLYESGVQYDVTLDGKGLYDVVTILSDPSDLRADIESLVAWRCAELRQQGIKAEPYIKQYDREGGGRIYTMVVRMPDGTEEDVVANLRARRQ